MKAAAVAAHLSPAAQSFLAWVAREPDRQRHIDHLAGEYPDWLRVHGGKFYPLQSWPTFVGAEKLAEIERATVELTRLVRAIPERLFDNDHRRMAAYYGFRHEALISLLLEPPNALDGMLVRNDYVDSPSGMQCVEVNAGQIGGWQLRYFEQSYRTHPLIVQFLAEEGLAASYRDPVATLVQHVIAHNLGKPTTAGGALNVVIVVPQLGAAMAHSRGELDQVYRGVLAASGTGLTGTLLLATFADLSVREGEVWHAAERLPVHAVVELSPQQTPEPIFRCFKAGRVSLYNGPINTLAGDKRNLALLSEHAESPIFTAAERAVLRDCLPWTRLVAAGPATWRGVTMPLPDLLIAEREDFVVKPCFGTQGQGVVLGSLAAPEAWSRLVHRAVAQGGWLAQERIDSRPYLYQSGNRGQAVHDVVWGTFCFGDTYGGGFLRMVPHGTGDGIINAARGAEEGILLEV